MAPFEALYVRRCRSPIGWFDIVEAKIEFEFELNSADIHVSMLRKCLDDSSQITPINDIRMLDSLCFKEVMVKILDWQVHLLSTKDAASIKVSWRNHKVEESTYEAEDDMKSKHPFLFSALKIYA
ncbi:uncharacterized protein LOC124889677 [Capsicum annuum]|uniref:uncharacterized protein LOC124889677 n=1 Tax=Capsicum annuum TaxID=4072 RepID=UPI001FB181C9|nr:uncharacterized protein LOC124889677 [Capsicum annuum]